MPLQPHQLPPLFDLAKEAYHQNLTNLAAAETISRQSGMALATANDLVRNLKHMVNGEPYTRRLAGVVTEHYLDAIQREFGQAALGNALKALWGHIEYYEKVSKTNSLKDRSIYERFSVAFDAGAA